MVVPLVRSTVVRGVLVLAAVGSAGVVATARPPGALAQAGSQAPCAPVLARPNPTPAYADTPWPTEHADVWRTHAAPTGLPSNLDRVRLVTESSQLGLEPAWGY